jgi:hypothetical protein
MIVYSCRWQQHQYKKSHENLFVAALTICLGLILSPLKGVIISKSLLQVAIEIVHGLKII